MPDDLFGKRIDDRNARGMGTVLPVTIDVEAGVVHE
jgi:sporulation protein YlmC with PRC-barrel domain